MNKSRSLRVMVREPSSFADAGAQEIAREVDRAVRLRGRCSLSLAGGSTPRPVYEQLARAPLSDGIEWERIGIYFGDERCVAPDDPQSNYRMAREALLDRVPIPDASVHRMKGEHPDRDIAAREYERALPDRLDVLLLGMGEDGHTASLFPGSPALAERERRVLPVSGPPSGPARLTITPPVIKAAVHVIVLAAGGAKAPIVARALEGPFVPDELPVQLALDATWIIDERAAQALRASV